MNLGDRIKRYEKTFHYMALKRTPLMIRVDGRAFHTFTKNMDRPFDSGMIKAMTLSAFEVAKQIQGFKVAYIQSDEATFCLTDYDELETQGWFDYDLSKVVSISSSLMTVYFNHFLKTEKYPIFDSRAFNVPVNDVVNAFLWRALDWQRNSVQMYGRAFFSHKQMMNKNRQNIHEMLYQIGKNWTNDLTDQQKNGTFIIKTEDSYDFRADIKPTFEDINNAIGDLFRLNNT